MVEVDVNKVVLGEPELRLHSPTPLPTLRLNEGQWIDASGTPRDPGSVLLGAAKMMSCGVDAYDRQSVQQAIEDFSKKKNSGLVTQQLIALKVILLCDPNANLARRTLIAKGHCVEAILRFINAALQSADHEPFKPK